MHRNQILVDFCRVAHHCRINPQHLVELGARMQLKYDKEAVPKKNAFVLMEDFTPSSADDIQMQAFVIPARADTYFRY